MGTRGKRLMIYGIKTRLIKRRRKPLQDRFFRMMGILFRGRKHGIN